MRAAIYARISDDRAGTGLGVQRQLEDCRALAEREGWPVGGEYVDNDVSAFAGKPRPRWDALVAELRAGRIDVVVAWAADRLYRRVLDLEAIIDLLEATGVRVATVTSGTVDLATPEGRAMARVGVAIASAESERKSIRGRRKALELAESGNYGGGMRAYGYEPDGVTVRPAEAEVVAEGTRRVLAGEPLRSIVRDLEARGVRSSTGKPWTHGSFRRTLVRWRNAGVREYKGEPVGDAVWPRLVDRADLERVRAILLDPSRRPPRVPVSYSLRGVALCGRCGAKLIAHPRGAGSRAYACPSAAGNGSGNGCGKLSVSAVPAEAEVYARVGARLAGDGLTDALARIADSDQGAATAAADLVDVRRRLEELSADYYEHGMLGRAEFLARRQRMDERVAALEAAAVPTSPAGVLAELPRSADGIAAELERRDVSWTRTVLGAVLERVTVNPAAPGGAFNPSRIVCEWRA